MTAITIRPATREDAAFLLPLFDAAGAGIPRHLWRSLAAPGQDPDEIGLGRIRRDDTSVSWRLAWVAEHAGAAAGCLVMTRLPDMPEPFPDDLPPMFVPLQQLEDLAAGTGHVHMIATAPSLRRKGVGDALMAFAGTRKGPRGLSLIVADANAPARRLYRRHGYQVAARRPIVRDGWAGEGTDWLLMTKP